MASNNSDPQTTMSWTSPGAGITGNYNPDSETLRILIVFFSGLAMYNALELVIMIFMTFKRFGGAYFWSLLISAGGIVPYSIGFLLKYMNITTGESKWLPIVILTIGWWTMVTGQSFVLWSRLHLIVSGSKGERIIRITKWMIIVDAIILHLPTTVLTFGSNGNINTDTFEYAYNIMEKIQMTGFFLQETILSSIYIWETARILRTSLQSGTRKTMKQLVVINVIIILMDLGLLGLEAASLYLLETLLKSVIYGIKLKLEFAILGRLVKFVGGSRPTADLRKGSVGFITTHHKTSRDGVEPLDARDFVDLDRVSADVRHPSRSHQYSESLPSRRKSSALRGMNFDYDMARFEHIEDVSTLQGASSRNSPSPGEDRESLKLLNVAPDSRPRPNDSFG